MVYRRSGPTWERRFDTKLDQVIVCLLRGDELKQAAVEVGVSVTTVKRWTQMEGFIARYNKAREDVFRRALDVLQVATYEAVLTLRRNLLCGEPKVEVLAAEAMLRQQAKWAELHLAARANETANAPKERPDPEALMLANHETRKQFAEALHLLIDSMKDESPEPSPFDGPDDGEVVH